MTEQLRPTVPVTHNEAAAHGQAPYSPPAGFPQASAGVDTAHGGGYDTAHGGGYGGGYGPPPGTSVAYVEPQNSATGWILGGAIALVVILLGGIAAALLLLGGNDEAATPAAPPPTAPAAAPAAPAPAAPAPAAPGPGATTPSGGSLETVFASSTGPNCMAYTPTGAEYTVSTGGQAIEVRTCAEVEGTGVMFTRWASPADAETVVTDQRYYPSADGGNSWSMGEIPQGQWHERTLDDGSCMAVLNYIGTPYAVMFMAPTCAEVQAQFEAVTLPELSALPIG